MSGKKFTLPQRFKKLAKENEQVGALVSWYEERLAVQNKSIGKLGLEIREKVQAIKLIKFIVNKDK